MGSRTNMVFLAGAASFGRVACEASESWTVPAIIVNALPVRSIAGYCCSLAPGEARGAITFAFGDRRSLAP